MAQLDKPIIHFQIPFMDRKGQPAPCEDDYAVSFGGIQLFIAWAKQQIGDNAYIIATPFGIDVIGAEVEKVRLDEMTLEEFFKKHDIKDGMLK